VQEPQEGCLGRLLLRWRLGEAKAKADRDSEVQAALPRNRYCWLIAWEERRRSPTKVFDGTPCRGETQGRRRWSSV
jgi:hypothetical protein